MRRARWARYAGALGLSVLVPTVTFAQSAPESVYAPPAPPREDAGVNEGGVNIDLQVNYATDYIYRGIEPLEAPGSEDSAVLQFNGELKWDLGRYPHPFIGIFANVAESDPISSIQEIRPYAGLELPVRPFIFAGGVNTYIFPDRDELDTSEVFARVTFDDSFLYRSDRPLLSPYVFAAYDYDLYDGTYIEAGVSHDFVIEDTGITLTANGHVAYVVDHGRFSRTEGGEDTGFQHYQVGLTGSYELNTLLNLSRRYGTWSLIGFINYTGGIEDDLASTDQLWGGAAIRFRY